ncbi:MAG TPA: hypothetical protein VIQ03_03695 [Gammaproteobacteria bacterium]
MANGLRIMVVDLLKVSKNGDVFLAVVGRFDCLRYPDAYEDIGKNIFNITNNRLIKEVKKKL